MRKPDNGSTRRLTAAGGLDMDYYTERARAERRGAITAWFGAAWREWKRWRTEAPPARRAVYALKGAGLRLKR